MKTQFLTFQITGIITVPISPLLPSSDTQKETYEKDLLTTIQHGLSGRGYMLMGEVVSVPNTFQVNESFSITTTEAINTEKINDK